MKVDKKIIIKVKSKTEQRIMENPKVEMLTTWNIKRILYAVLVLLIATIMIIYYLSQSRAEHKNHPRMLVPTPIAKQQNLMPTTRVEKSASKAVIQAKLSNNSSEIKMVQIKAITPNPQHQKQLEPKILNSHLARARLAKEVSDLEPYGEVELPIIINAHKAQGIFYFTDIVNMKGNTVFHEWLKQENSIYKRKFIIRGNRWRVSTSKLFDMNSAGAWQVRLITASGEILNKINFDVEK